MERRRLQLIVIMGPAGSGKSTLGRAFAQLQGLPFLEGDDFHPPANIALMQSGTPLSDAERIAWIDSMVEAIHRTSAARIVLACSALTPFVQHRLRSEAGRSVTFVMLDLPREELQRRVNSRRGHFMPPGLLPSQIAALQVPPEAIIIDAAAPTDVVLGRLEAALEQDR